MSCAGVGWIRLSCIKTGNKGILEVKTVYITDSTTFFNLMFRGLCIASIFLLIYFQQDATLHDLFISGKIALHVSGGISTHRQERARTHARTHNLQYLVLVKL